MPTSLPDSVRRQIEAQAEENTNRWLRQTYGNRGTYLGTRNRYFAGELARLTREAEKADVGGSTAYLTQSPTALAAETNQFMTGQALAPFLANLPGYAGMVQQRSNVIGQQLAGQVPTDVINQILQQAAERGIATGGGAGAPNANAAYLRALGLTSMGVQQQGMTNLTQAIADTPVPELLNPASISVPERFAQQELAAYRSAFAGSNQIGPGTQYPLATGLHITPWRVGG